MRSGLGLVATVIIIANEKALYRWQGFLILFFSFLLHVFFFFFFHLTLFMPDTQYFMKEIYRFYVCVYINRHIDVCLHTSAHTHTQIHTIFFRRRIQLTHEHDLCMQITEALKKQESPRIMTQHSSTISYTVSVKVEVSLMS